ncbi:MAG TPA: chloride channel protein [Polyangiales bacterium]|nr:chloride channel protein [Polyangiales bacterium]
MQRLLAQIDAEERRLLIQACVVGVVVWAFVAVLKLAVREGFAWMASLLALAPNVAFVWIPLLLGAALVSWVSQRRPTTVYYRDAQKKLHPLDAVEGDGLERAIALYFSSEPMLERQLLGQAGVEARWRMPTFSLAIDKMIASVFTLCSGGAGGLEASVTLVGESTAAGLFKPRGYTRHLPEVVRGSLGPVRPVMDFWRSSQPDDLQAAQLCGIAAAIATLLETPFAAAFFAIEVIYRRRPIVDRLIYALLSALIAFFLTHIITGAHSPFPPVSSRPPIYDPRYYLSLFMLAASMGGVSALLRGFRARADTFFQQRFRQRTPRHLAGAFLTGACAVVCAVVLHVFDLAPPKAARGADVAWLVLGTGENIIAWALEGKFTLWVAVIALVGRFCATISTISSGASAGLLFPTLCFGSLTACCWAEVFGFEPALLVIPGMTASLVSVANVPLAAILVVIEGFGSQWIVPAVFALVWASIFAHKNSIYRAQRETFESGQILPGVSVKRLRVPRAWAGASLRELGVRERFGLTVIGMVDRRDTEHGLDERVVLNPRPDQLLTLGDLLIVLGEDERLERFQEATRDSLPAPPTDGSAPSGG